MTTENIVEIGINEFDQLYIKPEKRAFTLIWRSATEVHWDNKEAYLYSPKPREWSYLDWYNHIVNVISEECICKLRVTDDTTWFNIPDELKTQILQFVNSEF